VSEISAGDSGPASTTGTTGETAIGRAEGVETGPPDIVVRAAGGAVWRRAGHGDLEVILVHRPRYDDWSLPKGKVDPGETDEEAAVREVHEEASLEVRLGPELPSTTYLDRSGKQKRVRYWAMTPTGGEAAGAHEVDQAAWVPFEQAWAQVTYPRDVAVLDALMATTGGDDQG
jgi:8-oxo-dGTP pyrophosphatase MutT (NUDIX family)